jgi:hypothetical protein
VVDDVARAEEQGKLRTATKRESMEVRLAALSSIVHKMHSIVEKTGNLSPSEMLYEKGVELKAA